MGAQPFRVVVLGAVASLGAGLATAPLAQAAGSRWGHDCPAAETLVAGTTWHTHKLAPGVMLSEGSKNDSRGVVKMHVLRITVGQPGVSFQPLMRKVAQRTPLSRLAAGHPHLVAAVNTGYFDFNTGAPTQPLIVKSQPLVMSNRRQRVVGFNAAGAIQTGVVHLAATLFAGKQSYGISGVNQGATNGGLVAYNSAWGGRQVPSGWQADARPVIGSKLGSNARLATVPQGGFVVAAHGQSATHWLSSLASGTTTGLAGKVRTTTKQPFVEAYGVGAEVVQHKGQTRNDMSCNSANTTQPARTAYGIADNGKTFVIGEVEDHPGTNIHGLDNNQMSGFMAQLGVDRAFDADGSGSTEMLAKLPSSGVMTQRTYPADGEERPMPVGLGISYVEPKVHHHHRHHHHKS
ncbi:MAG TPA: phosphodiester glycosidase family protein [Mycobacteriales bacterium]|nr:phosphodiester glycosidase family protein [Mycobacteriales bacterium]